MACEPDRRRIIALVDDDLDYQYLVHTVLSMIDSNIGGDVEIVCFNDGGSLIAALKTGNNWAGDIILLDINMPIKNGFEIIGEIRGNDKFDFIPIIIVTSSSCPSDILKAYRIGANSFITKPDNITDMLEMMTLIIKYWFTLCSIPMAQ